MATKRKSPEARLDRLEELLANYDDFDEAMLASEADGFLAAVIVSPDPIMPSKWLPHILGMTDGDFAGDFEQYRKISDAIFDHYNSLIHEMMNGGYGATFDIDPRHNELLWEIWADGFGKGMELAPLGWTAFLGSRDKEVIAAYLGLKRLVDLSRDETGLLSRMSNEQQNSQASNVSDWVLTLNDWRLSRVSLFGKAAAAKVGRNEPCPCGSGRKYKKCCGLN